MFQSTLLSQKNLLQQQNKSLREEIATLKQILSFVYDSHEELIYKLTKKEALSIAELQQQLIFIESTVKDIIPMRPEENEAAAGMSPP